ncbi:MAG: flagellar hook-basal body complex protein FliE, partial [Peptococcia bacterium]
ANTAKVENGFKDMLLDALAQVNSDLIGAEKLTQDFALGKDVELHQVMAATEQANLALQLTIQIRNKVIEAYQELMRMQL